MAKKHSNPEAAKAMRLHQKTGISLKAAWARVRGGGGGGHGKSKSLAKAGPSKSRGESLGAAYLNGKVGAAIAIPVIDRSVQAATDPAVSLMRAYEAGFAQLKASPAAYGSNVAVAVIDRAIDKKTGQAAAISRLSVTAIAPEAYMGYEGWKIFKETKTLRNVPRAMSMTSNAYDPMEVKTAFGDPRFVRYRVLKHGGQLVRHVANKTGIGKKIASPIKKAASALGVSL